MMGPMRIDCLVSGHASACLWQIIKQISGAYGESARQLDNIFQGDVSLASLDRTNIIPVKSRPFRKRLLREPSRRAQAADRAAKPDFHRLRSHPSSCRPDHYESTHDEWYLRHLEIDRKVVIVTTKAMCNAF